MPVYATQHQVNDQVVLIQIEMDEVPAPSPYGDVRGSREAAKRVISATRDIFGDGMQLARDCAASVVESISQMPAQVRPNEFEVQFAVKLDSEVGAVIAKMGAEAQLQINMKWTYKEPA